MPNKYYDLAITNVPFSGQIRPYDADYKKQNYLLHNFFFAKAMYKVRPGGLVAFITSTGTMQTQSAEAEKLRAGIGGKADLIAAFKLPNTAFDKNAGTQVTTDVLIFQKRLDPKKPSAYAQNWQEIEYIKAEGKSYYGDNKITRELPVNEYFVNHRENMIGKPVEDSLYPGGEYGRLSLDGKGYDVEKILSELMAKLPQNIFKSVQSVQPNTLQNTRKILANSKLRDLAFTEKDGKFYQNQNGELAEVDKKNQAVVKNYLKLMQSIGWLFL